MEHCLQIELASALLEKILKRLAEQIHNHHVVHLTVVSLLITDEVEEGHESLASHFVNELGLPEEHDMPLHFDSFLLHHTIKVN